MLGQCFFFCLQLAFPNSAVSCSVGQVGFCVRLSFGRLTQREASVGDLPGTSLGPTWLALSYPGVLALIWGNVTW